jgi:hypothetical protein
MSGSLPRERLGRTAVQQLLKRRDRLRGHHFGRLHRSDGVADGALLGDSGRPRRHHLGELHRPLDQGDTNVAAAHGDGLGAWLVAEPSNCDAHVAGTREADEAESTRSIGRHPLRTVVDSYLRVGNWAARALADDGARDDAAGLSFER